MALSPTVKNFTDGTVTIIDGLGAQVVGTFSNGDFSASDINDILNEVAHYESRGKTDSLRHTNRAPPSLSGSFKVAEFSEAVAGTMIDMVLGQGAFSARTSTGIPGNVTTLDVRFDVEGTDLGDANDHTFTMEDCRVTLSTVGEGDPNTLAISAICYGDITGDIAASQLT